MTSISRSSPNIHELHISPHSKKSSCEDLRRVSFNVAVHNLRRSPKSITIVHGKYHTCYPAWIALAMPMRIENEPSSSPPEDAPSISNGVAPKCPDANVPTEQLTQKELISLLADSERSKLIRKLSEANQRNRFLKRQLQIKEDALVNFKSDLAVMELEIQSLVSLAEEIAKTSIQPGSRKINGKYIHSHLISRLEAVHKKMANQIKDVEIVQSKEVRVLWHGMAESVQVMGSFDGWSQGEDLSPEYTGSLSEFSTTLLLRPGRYEIKFMVDGEWRLSSELPTIGEGMMENNLLIVE